MERRPRRTRIALWIIAAWAVPSAIGVTGRLVGWRVRGGVGDPWPGVWSAILPWATWALSTPIVIFAARRLPVWTPVRPTVVLAHLAIGAVLSHGYILSAAWWSARRTGGPFVESYLPYLTFALPVGVVLYAGIVFAVSWNDARQTLYDRSLQAARAEEQLTRARLDALQARIRPHFLFNALHSIGAQVRGGRQDRAVTLLARLGGLLRRVIDLDRTPEIRLETELELTTEYLEIERERFGPRLDVHADIPARLRSALVPGLILQPLVENAVIHGVSPVTGPTRLEVRARREDDTLVMEVENEGAAYRPDATTGVGLYNVRERLDQLYGDAANLELRARPDGGCLATARIPWHEEPWP